MNYVPSLAGFEEHRKLATGCAVCSKTENLLRCAGCKVLHYCSRDHQMKHREEHKSACSDVRRKREAVEKAKQALIEHPDFKNDNPFTNHVGRFWKIVETRPYMMGLSALIRAFQGIEHADAVQAELEICMEMLRLCPGDNMGVRDSVPGVMVRLKKDQECYDFIKWWETAANDPDLEYTDPKRYLNIKNADMFESVDFVKELPHGDLSHPICLMILKIKILVDMLKLQNSVTKFDAMVAKKDSRFDKLPPGMLEAFRKDALNQEISHPAVRARGDLLDRQKLSDTIQTVKDQINRLYDVIDGLNEHVWPGLAHCEETMDQPMGRMFKMGSKEEMRIAFNSTWFAWIETPGAYEFISFKMAGKLDELKI